jgi:hypothetical protein
MIEGSGSGVGSGSGSIPLTNESGSGRPKNMWIRNTDCYGCKLFQNGLNALHLASKEGHVHIVQDLLARGAKIDASTKKVIECYLSFINCT